ncbi:MAG: hypothetical protein ACJAZ2_001556, partial [Glaciecola sp.]
YTKLTAVVFLFFDDFILIKEGSIKTSCPFTVVVKKQAHKTKAKQGFMEFFC